jgi:hypothetical protein
MVMKRVMMKWLVARRAVEEEITTAIEEQLEDEIVVVQKKKRDGDDEVAGCASKHMTGRWRKVKCGDGVEDLTLKSAKDDVGRVGG